MNDESSCPEDFFDCLRDVGCCSLHCPARYNAHNCPNHSEGSVKSFVSLLDGGVVRGHCPFSPLVGCCFFGRVVSRTHIFVV